MASRNGGVEGKREQRRGEDRSRRSPSGTAAIGHRRSTGSGLELEAH